jgi:hypothetical protein
MNPKHELWRRGVLTWKLHSSQMTVYNRLRALPKATREAVVLISRRWGKSFLGVVMALEDCLKNPGIQVFIVGPDLKQTRRIVTPIINKIIADAPRDLIKQTKSELTWTVGESTLVIGAFDTALESMRGMEAYSIYLEESGLANMDEYEYILFSVLRPTLMHSRGRINHLTTPPKEENHPFVTMTMPLAELHDALMTYTIEDNPLLSKEEIDSEIEALGGRGSPHVRRELFCEIVRDTERLIVPEFDPLKHVKEVITVPNYSYFISSVDFGGAKDNHAHLLCYFDFLRNKVVVLDEVFQEPNTNTEEVIKACQEMEARHRVSFESKYRMLQARVVDAPGQVHVDLKRMDFPCILPAKGKDSVEDGVQALRVAFLRGVIEIHPRCKHLIQTLKYGMWDKNRKDFQRTPALGHCDMLASLSYNFRHINRRSNPFPPNLGLSKEKHYFEPEKQNDNETALNDAFYGD